MTLKHFHSRRSYRAWALWGGVGAALALVGLLAMGITGSVALFIVAGGLALLCLGAAVAMGLRERIAYELKADALLLRRGPEEEHLPLHQVLDANLIDLRTAKDYVQQLPEANGPGAAASDRRLMTRYCGIPLGGLPALSIGLTSLSAQHFRRTLVLLRIRDGSAVILSPRHSERMVSAIGKALDNSRKLVL